MARLFQGNAPFNPANYDATTGKFSDTSANNWLPFDYGSAANMLAKVDNTLAGVIMDCGECHVGGGAMQYVPNPLNGTLPRVPLKDIDSPVAATDDFPYGYDVNGDNVNDWTGITAANYTGFNYFIDVYDVDEDLNKEELQYIDFDNTGVMEMDCFICHLSGYDYDSRVANLRKGRIAAAAAIGAGIADKNTLVWDQTNNQAPAGYGTTVDYQKGINAGLVEVQTHSSPYHSGDLLTLTSTFFTQFKGVPGSSNCANCHFGQEYIDDNTGQVEMRKQVDWKKRGDVWKANRDWDVHYDIGCVACHSENSTASDSGHDPAKGDAPYSSLWNSRDKTMLNCEHCHGGGEHATAPNPLSAHTAAGLTDAIAQRGIDGQTPVSHIELMDCSACHVRKLAHYSGGAMVDATGPDHFGRLADHDNPYLERDMYDNLFVSWWRDWDGNRQLIKSSALTTMFWRDKNDVSFDGNNDGRGGGMDALLQTHVANINRAGGLVDSHGEPAPLTRGGATEGTITATDVGSYKTAVSTYLQTELGVSGKTVKPFLSFMGVPFKVQHNVSPAIYAWGANGCQDCHKTGAGFYNGDYALKPDNLTVAAGAFAGAHTPFTKGNGLVDATDFHPNVKDKLGKRTVAVTIRSDDGPKTIDRSELLYESAFKVRDTAFKSALTGGAISFPAAADAATNTKGWLLKIEVADSTATDPTAVVATYTHANFKVASDFDAVTDLDTDGTTQDEKVDLLVSSFTKPTTNPYYTIGANTAGDGLEITAASGYGIRLHPQSTVGPLKLAGQIWKTQVWTGMDGNTYAGRTEWVAYLDSIGAAPVASITAPVPTLDTDDVTGADTSVVTVGVPVTLTADSSQAGDFTYTWTCTDAAGSLEGASVERTFNTAGTFTLRLAVTNNNTGEVTTAKQGVKVEAVTVDGTGLTAAYDYTGSKPKLSISAVPTNTNRLVVIWGDGNRQVVEDVTLPVELEHVFHTYGDLTGKDYITEVRAVDYPTGGLLAKLEVDVAEGSLDVDGGSVVADSVAITSPTDGSVFNVDLVTLKGDRGAFDQKVAVDCGDAKVGSVWYNSATTWSADVQLLEGANTCTATVGTATPDTVVLTYSPSTGGPTAAPTNLAFTVDVYDDVAETMNVTLTGDFASAGNTVDVVVNFPGDAVVGEVTYPSATTFSAPITGLFYIDPNYVTVKEVDAAGNDGPGNYYTIQYQAP